MFRQAAKRAPLVAGACFHGGTDEDCGSEENAGDNCPYGHQPGARHLQVHSQSRPSTAF